MIDPHNLDQHAEWAETLRNPENSEEKFYSAEIETDTGQLAMIVGQSQDFVARLSDTIYKGLNKNSSFIPLTFRNRKYAYKPSEVINNSVDKIKNLFKGHDPCDIIVMTCQYLNHDGPLGHKESENTLEKSWVTAELVFSILLDEGLSNFGRRTDTASIIPKVIKESAKIIRTLQESSFYKEYARSNINNGIKKLSFLASSYEFGVRGRQYEYISNILNERIMGCDSVVQIFNKALGFSYSDIYKIREILVSSMAGKENKIINKFRSSSRQKDNETIMHESLRILCQNPSEMWLISLEDIVKESDFEARIVEKIMNLFSVSKNQDIGYLDLFLQGKSAFKGKGILYSSGRGYLPIPGAIAPDEIRRICEGELKENNKVWTSYTRHRDKIVEEISLEAIQSIFNSGGRVYKNLYYQAPVQGQAGDIDLSKKSTECAKFISAEADGLIVVDGIAICIEVKAGGFRDKSRRGGVEQLDGDLKKTISKANQQTQRLQNLITKNKGIWLKNGKENYIWEDFSDVHEVYSIIVCLEDLAVLSNASQELYKAEITDNKNMPWIASLHDLLVIRDIVSSPGEFVNYLRRRTDYNIMKNIIINDELDVFMWYIYGGFYLEDNKIIESNRKNKFPDKRRMVATLTDELDFYFNSRLIPGDKLNPPVRKVFTGRTEYIIGEMVEKMSSGWVRAVSYIINSSGPGIENIELNLEELYRKFKENGEWHDLFIGYKYEDIKFLLSFAIYSESSEIKNKLPEFLEYESRKFGCNFSVLIALDENARFRSSYTWSCE